MTDEETESEATPLGGPTGDATAPIREAEQDMETEGDGGNSPVTPNEDDLLTGAGAADVETGIASSTSTRLPNQGATVTPPPKNRQEGRLPEGRLPVQLEEWFVPLHRWGRMKSQPAQKRRLTILRIFQIKFNQFSICPPIRRPSLLFPDNCTCYACY